MNKIYYFGCIYEAGHYLWRGMRDKVSWKEKIHPWGDKIDGGIFDASKQKSQAGVVHHAQKDGWTAVYWADYSVDRRGNSHSTFVVEGLHSAEEVVTEAKKQWPEIFSRPNYPELTYQQ